MASTLTKVGAVLFLGITFQLAHSIYCRIRSASKARQLGCKNPPSLSQPSWDPLGLQLLSWLGPYVKTMRFIDACLEMFEMVSKREERHVTTMKYNAGGMNKMFTSDPKNVQAILATQFEDFEIGAQRINNFMPFLGPGIFNSNGAKWSHSRALLRPCFTRSQINDLDTQAKHLRALMARLTVNSEGWTGQMDLQPLFFNFTVDHATEFLFGEPAGVQSGEGAFGDGQAFVDAFDTVTDISGDRFRYGSLYWLCNPKAYRDGCKRCHDFIDHYVTLVLEKSQVKNQSDVERNPEKYVFLDELVKHTRDPLQIRAELINILLAGRDTTASLLGYLFALLARNPHVFDRLRENVTLAFGRDSNPKQDINFASLKACSYLQYTLSEVLRLHPSVPVNGPRTATRDTTLPRGGGADGQDPIFIPKGHAVDYLIYKMQRDKTLWGEDADLFKPERFRARKSGFEFLPFNAGPRVCIGQQFALTTAGYVTVKLLQRFDRIANKDPSPRLFDNITITSASGNGTIINLREAKT